MDECAPCHLPSAKDNCNRTESGLSTGMEQGQTEQPQFLVQR